MENFLEEYSKLTDESNAHLSYEAVAVYLNLKEQLSSKEILFIEKHLENCSACRETLNTVMNEDREFDEGNKPVKIFRMPGYFKYAAAAVILIAVAALFYFSQSGDDTVVLKNEVDKDSLVVDNQAVEEPVIGENDPELPVEGGKPVQEFASAEAFSENQVLENFLNRNVRSENLIRIINPSIGDTVTTPVIFKWKMDNGEMEDLQFGIEIVDNKNRTLYENNVNALEESFTGKLDIGLYYWKIILNGKLESVGKFYIK